MATSKKDKPRPPGAGKKRRRQSKKADPAARIIDAALALSVSQGWRRLTLAAIAEEARRLKRQAVTETLASELARLHRAVVAAAGADHDRLPESIAVLLSHVGVYRSDYRALAQVLPVAISETASEHPELSRPLELLSAALSNAEEVGVRLQQLE